MRIFVRKLSKACKKFAHFINKLLKRKSEGTTSVIWHDKIPRLASRKKTKEGKELLTKIQWS